jgi:hypothetical protein
MLNSQFYAPIRQLVVDTVLLLEADLGSLHQQLTQGLSVITAIEFSNDDFEFFQNVCQSPNPPTATELLAWIRLYVLNNPDIMSRDELFALIHRRCFPGEHQ